MFFLYLLVVFAILLLVASNRNVQAHSTSILDAGWLDEEERFRFATRWGRGF